MPPSPPPPGVESECTIMHDDFDYGVQVLLFFAAFSVLLVKWRCERHPRDPEVFALDAGKQGLGLALCHVFNVAAAALRGSGRSSECVWYAVNITFDCTVGVAAAYLLLAQARVVLHDRAVADFGVYGTPPSLRRWSEQAALWVGVVLASRLAVAALIWVAERPLGAAGSLLLAPLELYSGAHGYHAELVFVVVVLPLCLNVAQLLAQDSFLMHQDETLSPPDTSHWSEIDEMFGRSPLVPPAAHFFDDAVRRRSKDGAAAGVGGGCADVDCGTPRRPRGPSYVALSSGGETEGEDESLIPLLPLYPHDRMQSGGGGSTAEGGGGGGGGSGRHQPWTAWSSGAGWSAGYGTSKSREDEEAAAATAAAATTATTAKVSCCGEGKEEEEEVVVVVAEGDGVRHAEEDRRLCLVLEEDVVDRGLWRRRGRGEPG